VRPGNDDNISTTIVDGATLIPASSLKQWMSVIAYWAAAQLQPQRDQLALHCLKLFGFETYAPRLRDQRTIRGRKVIKTPLLFPGYVFVLIHLQEPSAMVAGCRPPGDGRDHAGGRPRSGGRLA
jgi:hypothetical protein